MPKGIRTPDPRLRRPLLYPAELWTHIGDIIIPYNIKAGDGNRTHVSSLEGWCSTIELHPHEVGVTGFEPATSWSQTRRSSQAEPHPEGIFIYVVFLTRNLLYYSEQHMSTCFFIFFNFFNPKRLLVKFSREKLRKSLLMQGFPSLIKALSSHVKPYLYD